MIEHPAARSRNLLRATLALGFALQGLPSFAEESGRIVSGFPLTPSADAMVAAVVTEIRPRYRPDVGARPVFLPGNSGLLAMDTVAKSTPDGGTAFMSASASMTLVPNLQIPATDPSELLRPVVGIGLFAYAFIVGPAVPADVKTIADYLSWARLNPTHASYGVPGRGTASHFIGTEIARIADVRLKAVGYKGLPPVMQDLEAGAMPAAITVLVSPADLRTYRSVRILAVSSRERWPGYPEVPTLVELGLADGPTVGSLGFYLPPRTPAEKFAELGEAVRQAVQQPSVRSAMSVASVQPMPPGDDYAKQIASERAEWKARVDRSHFNNEN